MNMSGLVGGGTLLKLRVLRPLTLCIRITGKTERMTLDLVATNQQLPCWPNLSPWPNCVARRSGWPWAECGTTTGPLEKI